MIKGGYVCCDGEGCRNRIKDHRWGHIKADDWFFQKDGTAYCPDHIPDWVEKWRNKNAVVEAGEETPNTPM